MQATAIEIHHLCKTYRGSKTPAVDHLSLNITEGAVFGLLGPNGAGKTTTIHILCGLRSFDSGEVFVAGRPLKSHLKEIRRRIGFVPQDIALYPSLTACENLRIFGGLMGLRGQSLENRINELLQLFGLERNKHRLIEHYSGGMKRRINLIAGLLHRPQILFLDEPTAGVDVQSKNLMLDNLKTIHREGNTIIYTSHYMEEAETLCTQIALIDGGKTICTGTPSALIAQSEGCRTLEDVYLQKTGKNLREE
ncbi:MAG: ABC transporter ATP-binding protein [Bacteroidales bacterium]|jgi:ABC-2 type transport system ATP-binding protein|nr:ABC transporter ATP-binding protein [Bacteroidales bacterium]